MTMNLRNERTSDEELAACLWRAITAIQAMTDRLLAQYEKSVRDSGDETYSLASLAAV